MRIKSLISALFVVGVLSSCGPGILYPQLKADKGTYDKPHTKIGSLPKSPWTKTTHEAVFDKVLDGSIVTIVGEIVDLSCYMQLGKHGKGHRGCAQKCMKNGNPIGLLDKDGGIYLLIAEEHHPRRDGGTNMRDKLVEHAAHIVEVTGTLSTVGEMQAIYIHGFLKK